MLALKGGSRMPRYLIERDFGPKDGAAVEESIEQARLLLDEFPAMAWEHSHMVTDETGGKKTFCVYAAPDRELLLEHAGKLGDHRVVQILEIGGDVTPGDFPI